jgi:hypothetical protein
MKWKLSMIVLAVVLLASAAYAQVDSGAISGVVTDATGAVIPNATVVITQESTNQNTELKTNGTGFYSAPSLRPGRYLVTVKHEGFRAQKSPPFELRIQDRVQMNFQLDVGAATAEIVVSAAAPLLESETSSLGHVVEQKTVAELPLNGRNYIQLATLGAGTLPSTRSGERDNFISNGARAVQNSYLLDGVDNKNRIMGFDKSSAQIVQPIIDAIQEFKVQTSTFSAEFGQAAGGVVNVTMKAGTNDLHGNLFEFFRNSRMDAKPYFQPAGDSKPGFNQNQFGATTGGRIIKDRTFFFGSWQSSRESNGAPQVGSVPTPAMRTGIFSKAVKDPAGSTNFPNNTIPASRWDPLVPKLLALYPLPNLPGETRNFFYNPKERINSDAYNVRIDHRIGSKDFVFGRISQNYGDNRVPTTLPEPANQQGQATPSGRSWMLSESHTLSPTVVNEFRFGFIFTHVQQDIDTPRMFDEYGIKGALNEPKIKGLPQININSMSGLGTQGTGNSPIAATGSGNFPSEKSGKIYQLLDNLSWVKGRHTVKFGVDLNRVTMFVYATNAARPTFAFNGTYTGVGLGDFLLGYVQNINTSANQQLDTIQQSIYHSYVQDDWKITKRLTMNIGLRYEITTPFIEEHDKQSNLVLDQGPCYLQIIQVADAGRCGVGRSLTHTDWNNLAPRMGLAYQASAKTVVRSGFGVFYGRDEDVGINRRLPNNPPWVNASTFTGTQTTPAALLKDGIPSSALSGGGGNTDVNSFPFDMRTPYVIQWNLNVQREVPGGFVAQAGYTGSEAHKLVQTINVNQAYPGTTNVNTRRPYQGFSNIQFYSPLGNSNYHALLGKLERRFSKGLGMLASYTYGHSIDDGKSQNDQNDPVPQDMHNISANRGSSNFDVRHRFVLSGLYQPPFGKGRGPLAMLVRDWQISGVWSAQTGQPFTVTLNVDPTASGATAHPDRLRDGSLPGDQRSVSRWFDTTAFVAPSCPCFGNSGRGILRSPAFANIDISVVREFHFTERMRLQVRSEAFNLFNHPNLGLPATAIGSAGVGVIGSVVNNERQIQMALKLYF